MFSYLDSELLAWYMCARGYTIVKQSDILLALYLITVMLNLNFSRWMISLTFYRFPYYLRKGDVVSCNLVDHIGTDLIVFVNVVSGSCLYIVRGPLPVPCRCSIDHLECLQPSFICELINILHKDLSTSSIQLDTQSSLLCWQDRVQHSIIQ